MSKSPSARVQLFLEGLEDRTTPSVSGLLDGLQIVQSAAAADLIHEIAQIAPIDVERPVASLLSALEVVPTNLLEPVNAVVESPLVDMVLAPVRNLVDNSPVAPLLSTADYLLDPTGVSNLIGELEVVLERTPVGPLASGVIEVVDQVGEAALGDAWDGVLPDSGGLAPLPDLPLTIPGMPPFPGIPPAAPALPGTPPLESATSSSESTATVSFFGMPDALDDFRVSIESSDASAADRDATSAAQDFGLSLTVGVVPPDVEPSPMEASEETLARREFTLGHERMASAIAPALPMEEPLTWSSWIFGAGQLLLGALALAWFIYFDRRSSPRVTTRLLRRPGV